uniref:F-box domain-containing protein n=1 Tax=Parastrongyloides trichosuri TaxID=131310 RepID=A0A0N5A3C1_PARTI
MISVTVAAHGLRNRRTIGTHFKAYDSGRLLVEESDSDLDEIIKENDNSLHCKKKKGYIGNLLTFIYHFLYKVCGYFMSVVNIYIPISKLFKSVNYEKMPKCDTKYMLKNNLSPMEDVYILRNIFSYLDANQLLKAGKVCKFWRNVVKTYAEEFDHFNFDQIRINLDEGQIIFFFLDEQRDPKKITIQSLRDLENNMKHIRVDSLFVRGMIVSESKVVMRRLNCLSLSPSQIYFLYCEFCPDSVIELRRFFIDNHKYVNDIGFEECGPNELLDDDLLIPSASIITNLRIVNTSSHVQLSITDKFLFEFKETVNRMKYFPLESIMINHSRFTLHSFIDLLEAWKNYGSKDLTITLQNATFTMNDLIAQCQGNRNIKINNKSYIQKNNVFCHINIIRF